MDCLVKGLCYFLLTMISYTNSLTNTTSVIDSKTIVANDDSSKTCNLTEYSSIDMSNCEELNIYNIALNENLFENHTNMDRIKSLSLRNLTLIKSFFKHFPNENLQKLVITHCSNILESAKLKFINRKVSTSLTTLNSLDYQTLLIYHYLTTTSKICLHTLSLT